MLRTSKIDANDPKRKSSASRMADLGCARVAPDVNIRTSRTLASRDMAQFASLLFAVARPTKRLTQLARRANSDQPIQILRANRAVFINNSAPKRPITPAKSHFARNPKSANTTNKGNETRLNRLIETKPAGPPLSVKYGNNSTAVANSVQLERSRNQPKTSRTTNSNVNQLACPHGFQSLSIIRVKGSSFSAANNLVVNVVPS